MISEREIDLEALEAAGIITTADKNLRSKIESIERSLQNLLEKKIRIEFEIKQQKKSLTRKREELRRVSKRNSAKVSIAFENETFFEHIGLLEKPERQLQRYDQKLLQVSSQLLESDQ